MQAPDKAFALVALLGLVFPGVTDAPCEPDLVDVRLLQEREHTVAVFCVQIAEHFLLARR